jgi:hypothetical protein
MSWVMCLVASLVKLIFSFLFVFKLREMIESLSLLEISMLKGLFIFVITSSWISSCFVHGL